MNNRHSSDFRRVAIERLFSSARRIFQPEGATLTDNIFENQLLCYVIENTALLTKTFFVFTVETLKVTLHPEL